MLQVITSVRQTLLNFFWRVLAFFKASLLFSTGTLIMGVLMLELATIRISLRLTHKKQENFTLNTNKDKTGHNTASKPPLLRF